MSVDGQTHQSPADVALLNTLADWKIIVSGNAEEAEYARRIAANDTGLFYIQLSTETNKQIYWSGENSFTVLRTGHQGTVIAVNPVADGVLEATEDLDIIILYAPVISPFDSVTLRNTFSVPDISIVEPYLEGTTAHTISEALSDVSHRILSIGIKRQELKQFGTPEEHIQAHGLDTHGLRERLSRFYRHYYMI